MFTLCAMAGSVILALIAGLYLSISLGEDETSVSADEEQNWDLSAGRAVGAVPAIGRHAVPANR